MLYGKFGINYDAKHLAKRFRDIFCSDKRSMQLISHSINKSYIKMYFRETNELVSLLNPKDYQNVPAEVKLLNILTQPPTIIS